MTGQRERRVRERERETGQRERDGSERERDGSERERDGSDRGTSCPAPEGVIAGNGSLLFYSRATACPSISLSSRLWLWGAAVASVAGGDLTQ